MRSLVFLLLFVTLVNTIAVSQSRPFLIALQVDDLERSMAWYRDVLGFYQTDKKEFKEYGLKIGLMKLDDFELELVENNKSENKVDVLKKLNAVEITGFAKVAFRIPDVAEHYRKLAEKNVDVKVKLSDSNINPSEQFFIIADPDGNWLQYVGGKG